MKRGLRALGFGPSSGAALALLALAACTPSFQSVSEVRDLRVLAIAAEPPEAFVDLDKKTVQAVHVRMLVADPAARAQVDATASLCLPTDNLRCGDQRLDLPSQRADVGELAFEVQPSAQLAALIVGALQDDKLKGLGGIRVQLSAQVADADPHGPVSAAKTLLFSSVPPDQANHAPRIARLEVVREGGATEQLLDGGTLRLGRFEEVGIRPILGPGFEGAETYTTTDLAGRQVTLTEQPRYALFATLGVEWDKDRADEPLPSQAQPTFGIARLRAYQTGTGSFWIVVRDGRGGESWLSASFTAG